MNESGMQGGGTIHSSRKVKKMRTFRSGPYLNELFARAGRMDDYLQAEICARIREARIGAGMTLEEMADALGIGQRAYWNYEHSRVPFRRLRDIAELTGRSQGWFLHGDLPAATDPSGLDAIRDGVRALEQSMEDVLEAVTAIETRLDGIEAALSVPEGSSQRRRAGRG